MRYANFCCRGAIEGEIKSGWSQTIPYEKVILRLLGFPCRDIDFAVDVRKAIFGGEIGHP